MKRREILQASIGAGLLGVGISSTVSAQETADRASANEGEVIFQFTAGERNVAGFIKHRGHIVCVYQGGAIARVHARTRRVQWSLELDDRLGVPLCVGEVAFVPADSGILYAVDMNGGRVAWRFDAEAQITTQPVLHRSSKTSRETLYFPTAGQVIIGINPATGEVANLIECEDVVQYPPLVVKSNSRAVADRLFTSNGEDRLVCRDLPSGEMNWQTRFRTSDLSSPSVAEGKLAVTAADTLHLYRSRSGDEIDTRVFESEPISPPTLYKNRAFIATIGEENQDGEFVDNTIHRISTLNGLGADYWTVETDVIPTTRPVVDDNRTLYAGGSDGVVAVDSESGSERWTQQIEAVTNLVLEEDQLHIGSGSGVKTLRRLRGEAQTIRSQNAIGSHTDTQGFADSPVTADSEIEDKSISGEMGDEPSDTAEEGQEVATEDRDDDSTESDGESPTESESTAKSGPDLTNEIEDDESDNELSEATVPNTESGSSVVKLAGVMTGSAAIGTGSVAIIYKKFIR